jgi:hypothetical protein
LLAQLGGNLFYQAVYLRAAALGDEDGGRLDCAYRKLRPYSKYAGNCIFCGGAKGVLASARDAISVS